MNSFDIKATNKRFYVYTFPEISLTGIVELEIISDTIFYATSVSVGQEGSATPITSIILQDISREKYTADIGTGFSFPVIQGTKGTPFFFPIPWKLKGGTIVRAIVPPAIVYDTLQDLVSIHGYIGY